MAAQHPSEFDLERASSGERVTFLGRPLARHIESCARCSAVSQALFDEHQAFLATRPSDAFVAQLERRVSQERVSDQKPSDAATTRIVGDMWSRASAWYAALLRLPWWAVPVLGAVALAIAATQEPALHETPTASAPLRWTSKGSGPSLYVLRRRDDEQRLEHKSLTISPGDELRLHFSLNKRGRIAAGILVDDGTWVPFFEREFEAGSHTPQETLRVDDTPNAGTLLFGAPEQVARARRGLDVREIQKVALVWTEPR